MAAPFVARGMRVAIWVWRGNMKESYETLGKDAAVSWAAGRAPSG